MAEYSINPNITTTGYSSMVITAYAQITISKIVVYANSTNATQAGSLTMRVVANGVTYNLSQTVEVGETNHEHEFDFGTITVEQGQTITISSPSRTRCNVLYGTNEEEYYVSGGKITSTSSYKCKLYMDSSALWNVLGYPELVNVDLSEFTYFEEDEDGYPISAHVWQKDDKNNGYPYIWLLDESEAPQAGSVFVNEETGLQTYYIYVNEQTGLMPYELYDID